METQKTVGAWIDATFPGTDPESPRKSIRALEEMVELCLASGASTEEILGAVNKELLVAPRHYDASGQPLKIQPEKILVEAADVMIVLYGVAHMRGFDLHAEVDKKTAVNRARKWASRGDGTGYHVKGAAP